MQYCPNCGKAMPEGAIFCGECGFRIQTPGEAGPGSNNWNGQPVPPGGQTGGQWTGQENPQGNQWTGTEKPQGDQWTGREIPPVDPSRNKKKRSSRETGKYAKNNRNYQNGGNGGNKSWILILAILAVIVALLGAAVYFFLRDRSDKAVTEDTSSQETISSGSELPAIGQTTPAPGVSGGSSTGESAPQLPALFGHESGETVPATETPAAPATEAPAAPATESPAAPAGPGTNPPGTALPNSPGTAAPGTATPMPTVELTPIPTPAAHVDSTDIHRYEVIIRDCTWNDAWNDSISRGGHLVRINSAAEMQAICDILNAQPQTNIHYYLGGSCDTATRQYHWIDDDGTYFDEVISDQNSWYGSWWYPGEPSYVDSSDNVAEDYVLLWNNNGWTYNDSRHDPCAEFPQWYGGKMSYICEFGG